MFKITKEQDQIINNIIINIVGYALSTQKNINFDYLFKKTWDILFNQIILYDADEEHGLTDLNNILYTVYQLNIREHLLLKIIVIFRKYNIKYAPSLFVEDCDLLNELQKSKHSCIFVSTHNGFAHNIKILMDSGLIVSTIGLQPWITEALERSGVRSHVNIINKDRYCLAHLKESLAKGGVIASTVDFKISDGVFEYISPAMFKFAQINSLPLYFCKCKVLDNGEVVVSLKQSTNSNSANDMANEYIQYHNSGGTSRKTLKVRNLKN
jgi:hypothetical protein